MSDDHGINKVGQILNDKSRPMKERFRALFTLRNIGGESSIKWIESCFTDPSALLKHECAYCLGQMRDSLAVPKLEEILEDSNQEPIVRHEAGEALAAIGLPSSMPVLQKYCDSPITVIAETCQLAIIKLQLISKEEEEEYNKKNPYNSIDPAPPFVDNLTVQDLEKILLDESLPLFERYRAMFSLRNMGTDDAILSLAKGLHCNKSALFRHEVAYVLGQIQSKVCEQQLTDVLKDMSENEMVRHECAEAMGAIASESCYKVLRDFLGDEKRVVSESCEVALDMCDYENSTEFQYANGLLKTIV